ncbi:hypothetical protein [Burkholderia sp. 3C]
MFANTASNERQCKRAPLARLNMNCVAGHKFWLSYGFLHMAFEARLPGIQAPYAETLSLTKTYGMRASTY